MKNFVGKNSLDGFIFEWFRTVSLVPTLTHRYVVFSNEEYSLCICGVQNWNEHEMRKLDITFSFSVFHLLSCCTIYLVFKGSELRIHFIFNENEEGHTTTKYPHFESHKTVWMLWLLSCYCINTKYLFRQKRITNEIQMHARA